MIESAGERVEQIGAVKAVIGSAVARRGLVPIVEFEELAGLHVARVDSGRCGRDGGDLVAKTDRLQRFEGLWTDVARRRQSRSDSLMTFVSPDTSAGPIQSTSIADNPAHRAGSGMTGRREPHRDGLAPPAALRPSSVRTAGRRRSVFMMDFLHVKRWLIALLTIVAIAA